jgi:hypothetical protein
MVLMIEMYFLKIGLTINSILCFIVTKNLRLVVFFFCKYIEWFENEARRFKK